MFSLVLSWKACSLLLSVEPIYCGADPLLALV